MSEARCGPSGDYKVVYVVSKNSCGEACAIVEDEVDEVSFGVCCGWTVSELIFLQSYSIINKVFGDIS